MGRIPEDGVFVGRDEQRPGLRTRLREAGESRRSARADRKAQKAAARPDEPEDVYGKAEGRFRPLSMLRGFYRLVAPWLMVFLLVSAALNGQRVANLQGQIVAQSPRSAPEGFAELCVGMFLSAGGEESASTGRFLEQCQPGVPAELVADQVPGGLLGAQIAAIEGKTFVDPAVPAITSVLVGVRAQVRQEAQAPGEEVRTDEGLVFYRVAVAEDDRGNASLVGLPVMTSEPFTDDPPTLAGAFRLANPDDARVDAAQRYIAGALMSGRSEPGSSVTEEGRGSSADSDESEPGRGAESRDRVAGPEQVLSPGVPFSVLGSDVVTGVQVTHAAIEERGGETYVVVAALVEYGESAAVSLTYSFQMVQEGARWEIAEVLGSPRVTSVDGRPVISQSESR